MYRIPRPIRRRLVGVDGERRSHASFLTVLAVVDIDHLDGASVRQLDELAQADRRLIASDDPELGSGRVDEAKAKAGDSAILLLRLLDGRC